MPAGHPLPASFLCWVGYNYSVSVYLECISPRPILKQRNVQSIYAKKPTSNRLLTQKQQSDLYGPFSSKRQAFIIRPVCLEGRISLWSSCCFSNWSIRFILFVSQFPLKMWLHRCCQSYIHEHGKFLFYNQNLVP